MDTPLELAITSKGLYEYVTAVRPEIERALLEHLPLALGNNYKDFNDALHYALFPGGKRLRPILTLLGAEVISGQAQEIWPAAVAIEYIHTSSLIFDDLPCMDNATERRRRPSLHMRYGEGVAMLVALTLMNASYGLILDSTPASRAMHAHRELVEGIGAHGTIAGQYLDLTSNRCAISADNGDGHWDAARSLKTSALISVALRVGAILAGATQGQLNILSRFGNLLGDAFQSTDNIIDVEEDVVLSARAALSTRSADIQRIKAMRLQVASLIAEAKNTLITEFATTHGTHLLCEIANYVEERGAS
jgi:geranylgeranyl diphosphate synthase type II